MPLLCAPVSVNALLTGKALGMLSAWSVMFVVATPYIWAVGASGQNLGAAMLYLALFGTPVVLGFGYLAMALSAQHRQCTGVPIGHGHFPDAGRKSASHRPGIARLGYRTRPSTRSTRSPGRSIPLTVSLSTASHFPAQAARLLLVVAWLGLCLLAARRSANHPNFQ